MKDVPRKDHGTGLAGRLKECMKRVRKECQTFQPKKWHWYDRWDAKKCSLAELENHLVSDTATLYSLLLHHDQDDNGTPVSGDKLAGRSQEKAIEPAEIPVYADLLKQAVDALLTINSRLTDLEGMTDMTFSDSVNHAIFLSHRGETAIKSYVLTLQHLLQQNPSHKCSTFLDCSELRPWDMPHETMIRTAMTCRMGVVTLSRGYFTSKWCLREFGIFTARRIHQQQRDRNPKEHNTESLRSLRHSRFVLVVDGYETSTVDLCISSMNGERTKLAKWGLPQVLPSVHERDFDHAKEIALSPAM